MLLTCAIFRNIESKDESVSPAPGTGAAAPASTSSARPFGEVERFMLEEMPSYCAATFPQ